MNDAPSRKLEQFIIRFPDGMRDRIRAAAEKNNRSMNAEIIASLEQVYPALDRPLELIHEFVHLLTPHLPHSVRQVIFEQVAESTLRSLDKSMKDMSDLNELKKHV